MEKFSLFERVVERLIKETFGSGTLRRIGELDQNIRAQEEFVNSL